MPELRYRSVLIERAKLDAESRTVDASLSSESPVERFPGEVEILSHDPGAVDLSRAADGLPFLFAHDHTQPIGIVENVRIEAKRLLGRLRFGVSQRANEIFEDVKAGVLKNISIGYSIEGSDLVEGGSLITRWKLFEASLVSVPVDASVGVGRSMKQTGVNSMTTNATENRARVDAEIRSMSVIAGRPNHPGAQIDPTFVQLGEDLIQRGATIAEAREAMFAKLAERANANPTRSGSADIMVLQNTEVTEVRAMAEALAARFNVRPSTNQAQDLMGLRVVDMARRCLELRGIRTTGMNTSTIIGRALHSTSDFPTLLASTSERILRQAYNTYQGGVRRICKQSTARDFRAKTAAALGEAPELKKVNEGGEFTRGTMSTSSETYKLDTYGRIFGISRQALINDDLGAFADLAVRFGRAAAEFEAQFLVTLLTSNPTMSDSATLFHANHGNLAGTGGAISVTTLGAARTAMRLQKGLDGKTPIDATPRYLVTPAALETVAEQFLTTIAASAASSVNPFPGKLELVVDPRLDAVSSTAWYVAADPMTVDTIEYSYLETEQGPVVETREGFEVDGMEVKVRLDFGAGVLDWRGLYRNSGA